MPEATENNENANDPVQSHEFELEYAFTNWWLLNEKVAGPPKMELSLNIGVQFGLTDATSDLRAEISSFAVFLANASLPREFGPTANPCGQLCFWP